MKEYIFNEKEYIESVIELKQVDLSNPANTIRKLARYNYYVNHYSKSKNYNAIVEYMSKNFKDFSEMTYQKSIDGCIRDVDKTEKEKAEKKKAEEEQKKVEEEEMNEANTSSNTESETLSTESETPSNTETPSNSETPTSSNESS